MQKNVLKLIYIYIYIYVPVRIISFHNPQQNKQDSYTEVLNLSTYRAMYKLHNMQYRAFAELKLR